MWRVEETWCSASSERNDLPRLNAISSLISLSLQGRGKLEYYIPERYTEERPGFIFTVDDSNATSSIYVHPLASALPTTTSSIPDSNPFTIFDCSSKFTPILIHKSAPTSIASFLSSDNPQLFIHTVIFNDATLLTVTFPHTLTDAMGLSGFLHAWTAILSSQTGRTEEEEEDDQQKKIPPFLGFDTDPLESQFDAQVPAHRHVLSSQVFGQLGIMGLVVKRWWENYWYPTLEDRMLRIPGKYIQHLRTQAQSELETDFFISESDVLLAWISNLIITARDDSPSTQVIIQNVFDVRSVLGLSGPGVGMGVYVGNATFPACTATIVHRLRNGSLSQTASDIRISLEQQRTPEQVHAMASVRRQTLRDTGFLPIFGDPRQVQITCTNWHRARFFELDFEGAVSDGKKGMCRPTYINTAGPEPLGTLVERNLVTVTGKDEEGNWWVQIVVRVEVWDRIREILRGMNIEDDTCGNAGE